MIDTITGIPYELQLSDTRILPLCELADSENKDHAL